MAALALAALLTLSVPALAQEAADEQDGALEEIERLIVYGDLQQLTQNVWDMLEISPDDDPVCQDGWYLHPKGFGFQIPDGMTLLENYRGTVVMLVDEADKGAAFSTTISVALSDADEDLEKLTEKDVEEAYATQFGNFRLIYCKPETMFGQTEGMSVCFVASQNPKLLFQQRMFNHGEHSVVISMTAAYDRQTLPHAWEQYNAFCDSLSLFEPSMPDKNKE